MLVVRDFADNCMIIVTVHPLDDEERMNTAKRAVVERLSDFASQQITSIYWQVLKLPSDPIVHEHLDG